MKSTYRNHRIGRSKLPKHHQLQKMSENLSHKFNQSASVYISSWSHVNYGSKYEYTIYIEFFESSKDFKTWPELLDYYFKLMSLKKTSRIKMRS